jgi:hypothetical protein
VAIHQRHRDAVHFRLHPEIRFTAHPPRNIRFIGQFTHAGMGDRMPDLSGCGGTSSLSAGDTSENSAATA